MGHVNLPIQLGAASWEKQKAPKLPATKLGDELKSLTKLHLGVDWDALANDKLDTAAKVQARLGELDAAVRGKIKALVEQAQTVEAAATRLTADAKKDSKYPKEPLAAAAAIIKAGKDYRSEIDGFVATLRRTLAAKLATLEAQDKKGAKEDAAKTGPDPKVAKLVRSRGLAAIRSIRTPAPEAKPVRFVIVQGKTKVATYMGPSVGPTQEKLLKGLIADDAPFKVFKDPRGELLWEKKSVTFVSDVLPAGLGKKMQLWLKLILGVSLKLRVRRTNGEAEETDGEDIPDDLLAAVDDEDLGALEDETEGDEAEGADGDPAEAAYARRAAELELRLRQALLDKHPESTKMRALIGFASEKAGLVPPDYAAAMKSLDMLEKLLGQAPTDDAATGAAGALPTTAVYTQTRQVWLAARGKVQGELGKLEAAIVEAYRGQPALGDVTRAVRQFDRVMTVFDESLATHIDRLLKSDDAAEKQQLHAQARKTIDGYRQALASDPLVKELDANPFVPVAVQATLTSTLTALAARIP